MFLTTTPPPKKTKNPCSISSFCRWSIWNWIPNSSNIVISKDNLFQFLLFLLMGLIHFDLICHAMSSTIGMQLSCLLKRSKQIIHGGSLFFVLFCFIFLEWWCMHTAFYNFHWFSYLPMSLKYNCSIKQMKMIGFAYN